MPDLLVDARHWTSETRGVSGSGGGQGVSSGDSTSSWWPTGCRSTWSGCPTAPWSGNGAPAAWSPRWSRCCAGAVAPGSAGRASPMATRTRSSRTTCGCTRCGCRPTTWPSTTRASRTPRCGRCTTTSSSSRSTTASGGSATSTSTGASPRPPRAAAHGATVWVQDYQLQLVPKMLRMLRPDLTIGFSCTSRSRRWSCSCRCRGGPRSSRACSAPTWSASTCPAARRTS